MRSTLPFIGENKTHVELILSINNIQLINLLSTPLLQKTLKKIIFYHFTTKVRKMERNFYKFYRQESVSQIFYKFLEDKVSINASTGIKVKVNLKGREFVARNARLLIHAGIV